MKTILFSAFILSGIMVYAQDDELPEALRPRNSVSISLLGDASDAALNYERVYEVNTGFLLTTKLGVGVNQDIQVCIFDCGPPDSYLTMPHHFTALIGRGRHFFEAGMGATIVIGSTPQPYTVYPIIGYRVLPEEARKVNFRIYTEVPLNGYEFDFIFIPVGVSLGVSF